MSTKLISLNSKDNSSSSSSSSNSNSCSPSNLNNNNKKKSPSKVVHLPKIESHEITSNNLSNKESKESKESSGIIGIITHNNNNNNNNNINGIKNNKQNHITHESRVILEPIILPHDNIHHNNNNNNNLIHIEILPKLEPLKPPSLSSQKNNEHDNNIIKENQIINKTNTEIIINEFTQLNGNTTIIYEMYKEEFPIKNGTILTETIDEIYGFSEIMPQSKLFLSKYSPTEIREKKIELNEMNQSLSSMGLLEWYLSTDNERTIHYGLKTNETYYCYIQEKKSETSNYENSQIDSIKKKHFSEKENSNYDDGRGFDSCTCIYGTPCQDEYGCKNWKQRFHISKRNGWKGEV